ncbi:CDK-activating kinase assembly factor MAT1 [Tetranychus urticae]|uniref:CDK-activating kinase assembly factor MAT1 n=1 Tax=Tetranychus urticae TaxID=32264 RepID=T1KV50_TETUR|nr:CDK-activating kinase assembly factor MAT1 [Tetranychus urticae]
MNDDISCPRCKTSKYRNPSLKLMVNVCGHPLCDNCVELLFVKGSSACPKCGITLRKTKFRLQLFEDPLVDKEVDIRRSVLQDFNKSEKDFSSLAEYNEYLEFVEDIIYNLTNNIDVESTKRKIEQYRKENSDVIARNRGKLSENDEELEELLAEEREDKLEAQVIRQHEIDLTKTKKKAAEDLVDDLMYSDLPANQILAKHANEKMQLEQRITAEVTKPPIRRPPATFSTGIKVGKSSSNLFLPVPKIEEQQTFVYEEKVWDPDEMEGPKPPEIEDLEASYLDHVRKIELSELAGGFIGIYPCYRAIQEAFCGLYYPVEDKRQDMSF